MQSYSSKGCWNDFPLMAAQCFCATDRLSISILRPLHCVHASEWQSDRRPFVLYVCAWHRAVPKPQKDNSNDNKYICLDEMIPLTNCKVFSLPAFSSLYCFTQTKEEKYKTVVSLDLVLYILSLKVYIASMKKNILAVLLCLTWVMSDLLHASVNVRVSLNSSYMQWHIYVWLFELVLPLGLELCNQQTEMNTTWLY